MQSVIITLFNQPLDFIYTQQCVWCIVQFHVLHDSEYDQQLQDQANHYHRNAIQVGRNYPIRHPYNAL